MSAVHHTTKKCPKLGTMTVHKYGIRGNALKLFQSYLSSRFQFVKVNGIKSTLLSIEYGVPQGSILGPLLFLLYINDLPNATNFFIRLFADDTFLCAQNEDILLLEQEAQSEIEKVYFWLVSNRLTLNVDKSKFMLITNKKNISHQIELKINGEKLEQCDTYKYLGVQIDSNLSWKPHLDYISTKIAKACGALSKSRHCVDINTLVNIYYALVHSYLKGNRTHAIITAH